MHGVRREAASRVALATAPPANPRPSAGLNESLALKSSTVSKATYVSMASVCGNGLNGICQRQGHTGVEREKEERRADRRTDRQTGRRTPGAVGGTWNNHISLRADLLAGRGTGCSSPALSTAPASVDAASSPPQTTRVSSSCARHPRAGSRGPSPPPLQPRGPSEGGPFVTCPKAPDGLRQAVPARISHLHEELEGP